MHRSMGFIYSGCFVAQESAHVWSAHGDLTKIQTGVKRVHRKGEDTKPGEKWLKASVLLWFLNCIIIVGLRVRPILSLNFFISSKNAGQKLSKNLRFRLRLRKKRWKLKSGSCLKRGEPNRVS